MSEKHIFNGILRSLVHIPWQACEFGGHDGMLGKIFDFAIDVHDILQVDVLLHPQLLLVEADV